MPRDPVHMGVHGTLPFAVGEVVVAGEDAARRFVHEDVEQSVAARPAGEPPGGRVAFGYPGRLVILSVHPSIRTLDPEPQRKGGHLVLAVGTRGPGPLLRRPRSRPRPAPDLGQGAWARAAAPWWPPAPCVSPGSHGSRAPASNAGSKGSLPGGSGQAEGRADEPQPVCAHFEQPRADKGRSKHGGGPHPMPYTP